MYGAGSRAEKPEKPPRRKVQVKLSRGERRFIIISDFLIVGFIILDLLSITDLIEIDLGALTLANLVMVGFTYYYFRFKRRITIKAIRETEKSRGNTRPR